MNPYEAEVLYWFFYDGIFYGLPARHRIPDELPVCRGQACGAGKGGTGAGAGAGTDSGGPEGGAGYHQGDRPEE